MWRLLVAARLIIHLVLQHVEKRVLVLQVLLQHLQPLRGRPIGGVREIAAPCLDRLVEPHIHLQPLRDAQDIIIAGFRVDDVDARLALQPLEHTTQVEAHAHLLAAQTPRLVQHIARGLALRVLVREAVGKRRNIGVAAQQRRDGVAPRGHKLPGVQLLHLGALGTTLAQVAVVTVLHARRAVVGGDEALQWVTGDQEDVWRSIQHPGRHRVHVHGVKRVVVCILVVVPELLSHDRLVLEQRVHDSPPDGVANIHKQDLMVPVGVIAAILPVCVVFFVLMTQIVDSGVVYGLTYRQGASHALGQIWRGGVALRRQSHENGALLLSRVHGVAAVGSLGAFSELKRDGQPRRQALPHGLALGK